ncbi:MAG: type II secretion system GspH family protein [Planctomycetaceae bacterium]|jgi:prepilin-type N-terminal cleavage/methylation domain-containing protein|nr:type II secretion system GspH family protein [Planctomycetaceae bacterium]
MNPIIFQTKIKMRRAFTLVELLTVVVIISMLAGMSMLALTGTMTAAKESKTRGTIAKLDAAILDIYESYQERFDKILDVTQMSDETQTLPNGERIWSQYSDGTLSGSPLAKLKLHLIYDLMRMEMPSYWNEIADSLPESSDHPAPTIILQIPIKSSELGIAGGTTQFQLQDISPVCRYYFSEAEKIRISSNCDYDNGPAEMLFLIIANLNPEALENFHGSEIGDTNNNGAREFLDAWGHPIYFLRFAPGFTDSDLQPDIVRLANLSLTTGMYPGNTEVNPEFWSPLPTESRDTSSWCIAYDNAMAQSSDPFDPQNEVRQSWFLYPLIVSAGADGLCDIDFGRRAGFSETEIGVLVSPTSSQAINPFNHLSGIPWDGENSGTLHHYDNIHNHRSNNSF